jgi:transposase InsO family protein
MSKDKKKMRNSKYTSEFRDSSVQLVLNSNEFQITIMCKTLKVDKASYYHWINNCTRRIKDKLTQRYGFVVSRRRIGRIMRELVLIAKTKKRYRINTTNSNHNLPVAQNILNRDFYATYPDEKYVGDITYIPTNEG